MLIYLQKLATGIVFSTPNGVAALITCVIFEILYRLLVFLNYVNTGGENFSLIVGSSIFIFLLLFNVFVFFVIKNKKKF